MVQQIEQSTLDLSGGGQIEMSYEAFAKWFDEGHIGEWVDGKVVEFIPPDERHQDVVLFIAQVLNLYVLARNLGKVMVSPLEMRIRDGRSYREPDVLFVGSEHLDRFDGKRLNGPADLVIEVVSDESVTRDRREKMTDYATAGIPEYWIIDPRPEMEPFHGFRLAGEGYFVEMNPEADGRQRSLSVPGFTLDPSWFSPGGAVNPLAALNSMGVESDR